jgi:hypothetical protein
MSGLWLPGLISRNEIAATHADWEDSCNLLYRYRFARPKEIQRLVRVHYNPF